MSMEVIPDFHRTLRVTVGRRSGGRRWSASSASESAVPRSVVQDVCSIVLVAPRPSTRRTPPQPSPS